MAVAPEEVRLHVVIRELLRPKIVLGEPDADFGLNELSLSEGDVGGYLARRSSTKLTAFVPRTTKWASTRYCVLDDEIQAFRMFRRKHARLERTSSSTVNDEIESDDEDVNSLVGHKRDVLLPYSAVVSVRPKLCTERGVSYCFMRVETSKEVHDFKCVEDCDEEGVINWCCALQLRTGTYDDELREQEGRALKAVLFAQSRFRGARDRARLESLIDMSSKKHRLFKGGYKFVQSLMYGKSYQSNNDLSTLWEQEYGGYGNLKAESVLRSAETFDDEDDDDENEAVFAAYVSKMKSPAMRRVVRDDENVRRRRAASHSPTAAKRRGRNSSDVDFNLRNRASSSADLDKSTQSSPGVVSKAASLRLPDLALPNEQEDELWENERWQAVAIKHGKRYYGWSHAALLPGERSAWTDRLGYTNASVRKNGLSGTFTPPGWRVVKDWTLDKSMMLLGQCDGDGWAYSSNFFPLDAEISSSKVHTNPSPRWLSRKRRWYRRRVPEDNLTSISHAIKGIDPDWLIAKGWLGMKGLTTGHWVSRFFILTDGDGRSASLSYFKPSSRFLDLSTGLFTKDLLQWTRKELKQKDLDSLCSVRDLNVSTQPGLFELSLTGKYERPRIMNAFTKATKKTWLQALSRIIESAQEPNPEVIKKRNRFSKRKMVSSKILLSPSAVNHGFSWTRNRVSSLVTRAFSVAGEQKLSLEDDDVVVAPPESPTEPDASSSDEDQPSTRPRPYEFEMFNDREFDMSASEFNDFFWTKEDFHRALYAHEQMSEVEITPWSDGVKTGSEQRRMYKMPRRGPVWASMAYHLFQYSAVVENELYVVDQVTSTPNVPYGSFFQNELRTIIESCGKTKCKVSISMKVTFLKSTLAKSFISKSCVGEIRVYYAKLWNDFMNDWLKTRAKGEGRVESSSSAVVDALTTRIAALEAQSLESVESKRKLKRLMIVLFIQQLVLIAVVFAVVRAPPDSA